jgi:hypothetical protein
MTSLEPDQPSGAEHAGTAGLQDEKAPARKGFRNYWNGLPNILKVLSAAITTAAALVGLAGGVKGLVGPSSSTPAALAASPTATPLAAETVRNAPAGEFRGFILRKPSLQIRSAPALSARIVGYLPFDAEVLIVCTAIGDPVSGPRHGGGTLTTPVWDKVRTDNSSGPAGFVPDARVDTGTARPTAHSC